MAEKKENNVETVENSHDVLAEFEKMIAEAKLSTTMSEYLFCRL